MTITPVRVALEKLEVPYAVGGSVAGIAHGYLRFTSDIDLVADLKLEHVDFFVRALEEANFYVDAFTIRDAIRYRSSFNVLDENTGVKVDVFISKQTPWDEQVLARREPGYFGDDPEPVFTVETAEDLVLSKLRWFRMAGGVSDKQWGDILAVLKVQSLSLDLAYLQKWAEELRLTDLLAKALDEAGFNE